MPKEQKENCVRKVVVRDPSYTNVYILKVKVDAYIHTVDTKVYTHVHTNGGPSHTSSQP